MTIKKSLIFAFVAATATVLSATQTMVGDVGVRAYGLTALARTFRLHAQPEVKNLKEQ